MSIRMSALARARQYRTCPPPRMKHDAAFEEHRQICPHCSADTGEETDHWETLVRQIRSVVSQQKALQETDDVRPGQLRHIRPELARWREKFFYTPPLVLVLETGHHISDDLLVAQTYHDLRMAGPGDLILTEERTGRGDLFAESWNTYTLKAGDLGPCVAQVPSEVTAAVLRLATHPEDLPKWAMMPRPLTDQDPRIWFRELEVEVGYTFASRSAEALMKELTGPELCYASAGEVREALGRLRPDVRWPRSPQTAEEALAYVRFPDEEYARAAEDGGTEMATAALFFVKHGRVERFQTVRAEIEMRSSLEEGVGFAGKVKGMPENVKASMIFSYFSPENNGVVRPENTEWDQRTGYFFFEFRTESTGRGTLCIAVICELG